jgi:hypothetical protein
MNGKITVWKPSTGRGQISASEGTYSFDAQNSPGLAGDLSNTIIPPDAPVAVTFDLAGTGEAINIVLATRPVSIAAAAAPMQVRSIAPQASIPKKPAKKLAKKKAAEAPHKTAKKKSADKQVAARKSRKQLKQPQKSAARKRRQK